MNATYTLNPQHNGIEITFPGKPGKAILEALKAEGFRWHSVKRLWYAKQTEKRLALAQSITNTGSPAEAPEAPKTRTTAEAPKANKYGVKVGDVFYMTWGYEQTNNNFFQVVKVCGGTSVRVVEVWPSYNVDTYYSHGMAEDRSYNFNGEMLPKAERTIFINDQEKGDIKKVTSFYQDGRPQIRMNGHLCDRVNGTLNTYESWYA